MAEILKGKEVAQEIRQRIDQKVKSLKEKGKFPCLAVLRVGANPNDLSYEKALIKNCKDLEIDCRVREMPINSDTEQLLDVIDRWNRSESISGILVFRPLPKTIDEEKIRNAILPEKDVDAMHPLNLAQIFQGDFKNFVPATPQAVMEFIRHYTIDIRGKIVAVVNRSLVFGRPLAMMLLNQNACPLICHSKTRNLSEVLKSADVVVLATGQAKTFGKDFFTPESIILDVGVNVDDEGKLSGDADFENLKDYVKILTPPKGGIGSTTTAILLEQVVDAAIKQREK